MTLKERIHVLWDEDKNGCHIPFELKPSPDGYFFMQFQGKNKTLHHLVYEYHHGETTPGIIVRHKCNNSSCINPDHLLAGTHADNVQDRVMANHSAKGEHNGRSKLNENQVKRILKDGLTPIRALAREYGVDPSLIRQIKKREIWTHL